MSHSTHFPPNPELSPPWPTPDTQQAVFVAANATILGHVVLAPGSSVWYTSVLRGDVERIAVGSYTNIQDGAVLHGDPGQPTILEDYVTVGHRAVVHSAYVERGSLIGIGAIILNGARIGTGSIIGAGAVVTKEIPPKSLVMGIPGRVVRTLSDKEVEDLITHAQKYYQLALAHAGKDSQLGFS